MIMPTRFPVVIVHTTSNSMDTRMLRDYEEYNALIQRIMEDPTTVSYEVFVTMATFTKAVEWKQSPKPDEPWN